MDKYTKEELYKMDATDVYKMVLKGDVIKKFPNGFWKQPEAKQNAAKCTRYLIEEILQYDEDMLKKYNSFNLFVKNRLLGMLKYCFNGSPYEAINNAYPNKYKEWEFKSVPREYWKYKENGISAVKWLIEEKLELSDDEIKEQLSQNFFRDNGLKGMLNVCFNGSPYEAINSTYPNKFKEWEFKQVPMGFWENKENALKATKWLIEEKLILNDEQIKEQFTIKLFKENGLGGMLQHSFNDSPYEAVNSVYPNKFKEWELKSVPQGYWTIDTGTKAVKWLIEEKLKLTDEEIKEQFSTKLLKENRLDGMLHICFKGSSYEAINNVYPNRFKEWEFKQVPLGFWDKKENGIKAVKWLIEEKLKITDKEIKEHISSKFFIENELGGMLQHCFNGSPYQAINSAYPNKFKEWEFNMTPLGFWKNKDNGIKATKWLIEEKLNLDDEEIKEKLSFELFIKNGLGGMIQHCFNGSPYEAINTTYPNKFKKSDFRGYVNNNKAKQ